MGKFLSERVILRERRGN